MAFARAGRRRRRAVSRVAIYSLFPFVKGSSSSVSRREKIQLKAHTAPFLSSSPAAESTLLQSNFGPRYSKGLLHNTMLCVVVVVVDLVSSQGPGKSAFSKKKENVSQKIVGGRPRLQKEGTYTRKSSSLWLFLGPMAKFTTATVVE